MKQSSLDTQTNKMQWFKVVFNILNTERYQYIIYSWNYGIELIDLYGQPVSYVIPELKKANYRSFDMG